MHCDILSLRRLLLLLLLTVEEWRQSIWSNIERDDVGVGGGTLDCGATEIHLDSGFGDMLRR